MLPSFSLDDFALITATANSFPLTFAELSSWKRGKLAFSFLNLWCHFVFDFLLSSIFGISWLYVKNDYTTNVNVFAHTSLGFIHFYIQTFLK